MISGLGYSCFIIGAVAAFISSSDGLIESVAPIISPHLSKLELFLNKIGQFEETVMKMVPMKTSNSSNSTIQENSTRSNDREDIVEMVTNPMRGVLHPTVVPVPESESNATVTLETHSDDDYVFAEADDSVGLRKRVR
jgi:hypothetical protein